MNKKNFTKIFTATFAVMFALGLVLPAKAFYMEVPESLKILMTSKPVQGNVTLTQYSGSSGGGTTAPPPPPSTSPTQPPPPSGSGSSGGTTAPPPPPTSPPPPPPPPQPQPPINQPAPQQPMQPQQNQNNQPWANMCQNNTAIACADSAGNFVSSAKVGPDGQPVCPANSSAQCGNFQQNNQQQGQPGQGPFGNGQGQFGPVQMGPGQEQFGPGGGGNDGHQGPSEEQQKQQQERQMKDMKRGINQMQMNLNRLEKMFVQAEKKGVTIPQDVKDKLDKAKSIISAMMTASTPDELQAAGMDDLSGLMQDLEEARQTLVQNAEQLQQMKRGLQGLERGLAMFDKQIAKLTKQGVAVPADLTDNLAKVKAIVAAVKNAQTLDEAQKAGLEDLQDLMDNIDQSRQQLEVIARWPQTLKQVDGVLKQLNKELSRDKSLVDRLNKKGVDLSSVYSDFADAVAKLQSVRDDATAKMQAGQSEDAFSALEDDFFGQMDDVWQKSREIQLMSNLGKFASQFKQHISQAKQQISRLARQKIDTSDLENLLAQAQTKGQEILDLMKAQPIDTDAVTNAIEELQNLQQDFDSKVGELTGQEESLPWEQGPQQFQELQIPSSLGNLLPQKQGSHGGENGPMMPGGGGGGVGTGPGF